MGMGFDLQPLLISAEFNTTSLNADWEEMCTIDSHVTVRTSSSTWRGRVGVMGVCGFGGWHRMYTSSLGEGRSWGGTGGGSYSEDGGVNRES